MDRPTSPPSEAFDAQFNSLAPRRDYNRRDFVSTAVGGGFAAAVLPVSAETIHTDVEGLDAQEVTIRSGDFDMTAYSAAPAGKQRLPVVLVVSEIFGLHEHIRDVARRFAKLGYLAVAPELFARQGDAKSYTDIPKLMTDVIAKVPDAQVMADLDAVVAWAAAHGGDTARLGITGFCWGGRVAWLYDAHNPKVKAAVAWYGRLVGDRTALTPDHPIDVVSKLHAPVLGLYGADDQGIPLTSVNQMKDALAAGNAAAKRSEFVVYPGVGHAFNADYRPSYRKEAALDGWTRCTDWLKAHGVA